MRTQELDAKRRVKRAGLSLTANIKVGIMRTGKRSWAVIASNEDIMSAGIGHWHTIKVCRSLREAYCLSDTIRFNSEFSSFDYLKAYMEDYQAVCENIAMTLEEFEHCTDEMSGKYQKELYDKAVRCIA